MNIKKFFVVFVLSCSLLAVGATKVTAIIYSPEISNHEIYRNYVFSKSLFPGNIFTKILFTSITFKSCIFDAVAFVQCIFNNCMFENCDIKGLSFLNCTGVDDIWFIDCNGVDTNLNPNSGTMFDRLLGSHIRVNNISVSHWRTNMSGDNTFVYKTIRLQD